MWNQIFLFIPKLDQQKETIIEYFCEVENNDNNSTVVPISLGEPEWAGPTDGSNQ